MADQWVWAKRHSKVSAERGGGGLSLKHFLFLDGFSRNGKKRRSLLLDRLSNWAFRGRRNALSEGEVEINSPVDRREKIVLVFVRLLVFLLLSLLRFSLWLPLPLLN